MRRGEMTTEELYRRLGDRREKTARTHGLAEEAIRTTGCAFVTGSPVVTGTVVPFLDLPVPTVFYGVTISAAAEVLGLRRFCRIAIA